MKLCKCGLYSRVNKFIDQSKKKIKNNILTTDETHELARETAHNIIQTLKEMGHPILKEQGQEEQFGDDEEDEEQQAAHEEEEGEEEKEEEEEEEEEEEVIHMYSDEDESLMEPSLSILDKNYA